MFKQKLNRDRSKPKIERRDSFVSDHDPNERNYGFFDAKNTEVPSIIRVPDGQARKLRA